MLYISLSGGTVKTAAQCLKITHWVDTHRKGNKPMLENKGLLKHMDLQLFAEGDPDAATPPATPPAPAQPATPAPVQTTGKTFSEDYVHDIREEAKAHRLAKQTRENQLRDLLGVAADVELTPQMITDYKNNQGKAEAAAMAKANNLLIKAEIKALDGYKTNLVSRLLDTSTLTIAEDGTVTGLKEALEALAVEVPEILKDQDPQGQDQHKDKDKAANPPPKVFGGEVEKLKAAYEAAEKSGNFPQMISIAAKIKAASKK